VALFFLSLRDDMSACGAGLGAAERASPLFFLGKVTSYPLVLLRGDVPVRGADLGAAERASPLRARRCCFFSFSPSLPFFFWGTCAHSWL
jgi:hypothetical protein